MRIAIVASDYFPTVGGVQTAVRNIAHHAKNLGHAVTILSALPSSAVPQVETIDNVVVHRFPWGRHPVWSLPFRATQTVFGMARVLNDFKPDVVYVHFCSINALWVLFLHYVLRFRVIPSCRGNDIQGIPLRSGLQRWMLHRLLSRADAILFCSSYVQRDAVPYLGHVRPDAYVGVVGDGFNAEEFLGRAPFVYTAPYLLGMGRLVHKKGFDLLIRAFASLADEFPNHHLLIAGDGEERTSLEKLLDELRMRERVKLLGFTDREKSIALFLGCEFFVLSSRLEPFGIVVLEAMAAHKAVLATKSGGVVDLVQDGVSGKMVEPTQEGLAQGMREMLANSVATRAMSEHAFATIEHHTWEAVTKDFIRVFERVVSNDPAR